MDQGIDIEKIRVLLGYNDSVTTRIYVCGGNEDDDDDELFVDWDNNIRTIFTRLVIAYKTWYSIVIGLYLRDECFYGKVLCDQEYGWEKSS